MQLRHHFIKLFVAAVVLVLISSCSTLGYYWQAASGHVAILNKVEPIDTVLAKPGITDKLRQQLQLVQRAREFASRELLLPDNDSYRGFAELDRPFAVWNVVATPEFAVQPQQWCFLFVGCVPYRGYFDKAEAQDFGNDLQQQGMDVFVGGVSAYSTLGYFDDPLVSSMLRTDEAEMVGLLFHELAHQLIYVDGDTDFNEAFATTVELEGIRRWFAREQPARFDEYALGLQQRGEFYGLLRQTRSELQQLYGAAVAVEEKRSRKTQCFVALHERYQQWRATNSYDRFDRFMAQDLNNAHLAIIATYHELVPHFSALLAESNNDLAVFYKRVEQLGEQEKQQRLAQLTGREK